MKDRNIIIKPQKYKWIVEDLIITRRIISQATQIKTWHLKLIWHNKKDCLPLKYLCKICLYKRISKVIKLINKKMKKRHQYKMNKAKFKITKRMNLNKNKI